MEELNLEYEGTRRGKNEQVLPFIEFLCREGANMDAHGADGLCALHHAMAIVDVALARTLLANGANKNVRTFGNDGFTPLLWLIRTIRGKI
ncbi:hypothetical protein PHISCL_06972 [Aspergillus sclerotialis]|uniref:Uncharacterized protein n=1 Tax=Aspergillus sclerotialis TaxID=2070753 RepID=A0A3A2ZC07_9EURO|nr:hypothetical protein PHISCL_06972 [Aspergillus sclerotialis]